MIQYIVNIKHRYPYSKPITDKIIECEDRPEAEDVVDLYRVIIKNSAIINGRYTTEHQRTDMEYIIEEFDRRDRGDLTVEHFIDVEKILKSGGECE